MARKEQVLQDVVIKFAGDSGDGMQLTGSQFTNNTALLGVDLATFPDFPAEIRAPQGTLPGVSGFQLRFSSDQVYTPGDECDVLVAMNAAALKANLKTLKKGGKIIANTDGFDAKNLRLANYPDGVNPLEDGSLGNYEVIIFFGLVKPKSPATPLAMVLGEVFYSGPFEKVFAIQYAAVQQHLGEHRQFVRIAE